MDNPLTILDGQSINPVNPWAVMNAEVFLYYCCPECESRFHDFQEFENHALDHHPKAKVLFSDEEDYEDNFDVKIDLPDHGKKISEFLCYSILREINFDELLPRKMAFLTNLEELNYEF